MDKVKKLHLGDALGTDLIMGIDLGTTNSAVAVYTNDTVPTLCPMNSSGKTTLQSCVRWDGGNKFTVGPEAYAERYNPNVKYSVKRMMGSGKMVSFKRTNNSTGEEEVLELSPAQVSAEILKALVNQVHEFYPGLYRCIITVPAYFNQRQIQDTLEAAKIANLDCVQVLKEPTSASYIYSNLGYAQDGSVLVYDLGGGTFDVTVMSFLKRSSIPGKVTKTLQKLYKIDVNTVGDGESSLYFCRVLGTYGDTMLGGDDIDRELATIVSSGKTLSEAEFEELVLRCEQCKKNNAEAQDVNVQGKLYHVTQSDLNRAIKVVFDKTLAILNTIPKEQLDQVKTIVLVGGSTKSQYLVDMISQTFPNVEISRVLDPDATVALGAGAVAKDLMAGRGVAYQDVLPLAIGVLDNSTTIDICVPKNTVLPYTMSRTYHTVRDNQEAVSVDIYQGLSTNPKECTYLGRLRVADLPPRPAGELDVTVSFLLSAQGRLKVTSTVEGVSKPQELFIDSIFDVARVDNKTASEFNQDMFEQAFGEFAASNSKIAELLMERRACLKSDPAKAEQIEARILEEI